MKLPGTLLSILMAVLAHHAIAQTKEDKFQVVSWLDGKWEGTLNFKIFREKDLRDEVQLTIEGVRDGDKAKLAYTYYKDGNIVREGDGEVLADDDESTFLFNDRWSIAGFDKTNQAYEIILISEGRDNKKRATLKRTIIISEDELIIRRDVKYKKSSHFFNRHVYSLKKVSQYSTY